jgi:hypothetical protein
LTIDRIRLYGDLSGMIGERFSSNVLNLKVEGNKKEGEQDKNDNRKLGIVSQK